MNKLSKWLIVLILFVHLPVVAAEFRAGAAAVDITPRQWPVSLVGSFKGRLAEKAWDKLYARALVMEKGQTRIAIVIVDNCIIARSLFDSAKHRLTRATGLSANKMLMAATHTHSAPPSSESEFTHPTKEYQQVLINGIVQAVKLALKRLEPALAGWAQLDVPEHVFCRRWHMKPGGITTNPFGNQHDKVRMNPPRGSALLDRPAGPVDPQVSFVSIRATDGRPLALLANYSLHYVGGISPGGVSADYFGEFARQIQQRIVKKNSNQQSTFVGILSNGTSGDINNYNFRNPRPAKKPFEQMKFVASDLAEKVYQAFLKVEHRADIKLAMLQTELAVNIRKPTEADLVRSNKFLAEKNETNIPRLGKFYANSLIYLSKLPEKDKIILQAIRVGDIAITANPCEMFAEIGLNIKDDSPFQQTFNIELANGWSRYLPTPEQHKFGGYETWMGSNLLEVNASNLITKELLKLLNQLKSE